MGIRWEGIGIENGVLAFAIGDVAFEWFVAALPRLEWFGREREGRWVGGLENRIGFVMREVESRIGLMWWMGGWWKRRANWR